LHANIRKLTQLQSLRLFSCSSMTSLPPWLGKLTHLKELEIWECLHLRSSLEKMEQLTSVEYLTIQHCPGLLHSLGLQVERDEFIWSRYLPDKLIFCTDFYSTPASALHFLERPFLRNVYGCTYFILSNSNMSCIKH
jgi:hypothetical protein